MEDEINLLDYWRVIVKRRWLIAGLAVITAFSALVFSLRQPRLYKASATIMTVEGGGGGLASALAAVPFLSGGGRGSEGKLIPILNSTTLAKQVAQNLDLPEFFPRLYKSQKLSEEKRMRFAVGMLREAVDAKSSEGLLNISVIWRVPEQAAELANLYVEQLGKFLNMRSLNVNFHIIDPAVTPRFHFKPKTKLNVMIGAVLGLFMGVFIAFFLEYLENLPKADHRP